MKKGEDENKKGVETWKEGREEGMKGEEVNEERRV